MKLSARHPLDLPGAHRALMAVSAKRLRGHGERGSIAVRAALEATAAGRTSPEEQRWLDRVEGRRAELPFELVAAIGDEEARPPAEDAKRLGDAWEVSRWLSIPALWGRFLMMLVRELAPSSCLELGTGWGLSAAYQGAALELNGVGELVTLDGDDASRLGEQGIAALGLDHRVSLEFGPIDETLPGVLGRAAPVDYAFLDADHSEAATVRHFNAVLEGLAGEAVVVLDDITQSGEMRSAWRTIAASQRVVTALNLRRVGVVVTRAS